MELVRDNQGKAHYNGDDREFTKVHTYISGSHGDNEAFCSGWGSTTSAQTTGSPISTSRSERVVKIDVLREL